MLNGQNLMEVTGMLVKKNAMINYPVVKKHTKNKKYNVFLSYHRVIAY